MKHLEKSKCLHNKATELLKEKKLHKLMSKYGEVIYTGSFDLDLMVWPDIDIQLVIDNNKSKLDQMLELGRELLHDSEIKHIKLINFTKTKKSGMPRGMFLGMKIKQQESPISWKIDIWSLEDPDLEKSQEFSSKLKQNLTPELKELIIKWKFKLMGDHDRVPQLASYFLYQAILLENLRNDEDIISFLKENGVNA